jgi:diguanylate cyclase (GGDEF)-like protein/putative nucleotidyltransferase with HDIG domain
MTWREQPRKLKLYVVLFNIVACPILVSAIWDVARGQYDSGWIILTILAVLTIPFYLFLPSVNTVSLIGDAYMVSISMLYGSSPCVLATFCHSLTASLLAPKPPNQPKRYAYRMIFNLAGTVCCAWAYSHVYHLLNPSYSKNPSDIALPLLMATVTFFILNSISTAAAICLSSGQNLIDLWVQHYSWLGFEFAISSLFAAFIVVLYRFGRWVPFAAAPLVAVLWYLNSMNKAKAMEAERHLKEQQELHLRTVESLALAVDGKDQTTYGHIRRVRVYATKLAKLCGIKDPKELMAIETGSLLHDIGKLAIDDYLLNKPGKLSKQEFEKVKVHAAAGDEILQQIRFPFPVALYVRSHHERWDGLGYPDGLKGEEIPLGSRILAIADAFDAIRFSRPYKLSMAMDETIELMKSQSGIVYDPELLKLFLEHIHELDSAAQRESQNVPKLSFQRYFEKIDRDIPAAPSSISSVISRDAPVELIQLAEFCDMMYGHLALREILPLVAGRLQRLVPFTTCVFYLDTGTDFVEAAHASGKNSELIQEHIMGMGKGISGWVAAYKRPMMNSGAALDFQGILGDFGALTDSLVVPIVFEDQSLGTISLYAENPISYTNHELELLQTVASFVAPLISEAKKPCSQIPENCIDPVTQLHRVSYLSIVGPQLIAMAAQNRTPISLIYIELRNLYQITRVYGENIGKSILRRVSECIKPELRETDILVCYGYQGFVALLPGVRMDQAVRCVQRLKQQVRNEGMNANGQTFPIDYRAAASCYPVDGKTIFALIQSAQDNIRDTPSETTFPDSKVVDFFPRA